MRLSYENRVVLILTLVGGIAAVDMVAFNFLSPFVASDLHLDNAQVGGVGSASMLAWALGAIGAALWSDRIGRRRVFLVCALVGFALLSTVTAFAASFLTLLAARAVIGLIEGPVVPMQNAIMHAESSPHRRGMNMGIAQNFGSQLLAGLGGPLILVGIATRWGWRDAFLIAGAPALVLAAAVRFWLREPARVAEPTPEIPLWRTIRAIAAVRNIRLCLLIGSCAIGWWGTITVFIPLWMIRHLHFTPGAMGIAMAGVGLGGAASSILVPALSDRFGRRPMVVAFALAGLILPLAMLFGPATLPAVAGAVLLGTFFTGIYPLFIGIIPMESVDARHGATALAIVLACAQVIGSVLGPLLGGVLADRTSLAVTFWMAIGFALAAAMFGLFLTETAPARTRLMAHAFDRISVD